MTNREFFIYCWEDEYPVFLRALKALPADRLDFRPYPNSRTAAEIAWIQILEKRCWIELIDTGDINWKNPPPAPTLDEMISEYKRAHAELFPRLRKLDDRTWNEKMTRLLVNGKVFFETVFGHMFWLGLFRAIHHRGELSVYIAAMGGTVPAIYVPSDGDRFDQHKELMRLDRLVELQTASLNAAGIFRE